MDDHIEISWSKQLEELIASEGEKCRGLSWIHRQSEIVYNKKNNGISIPVIVLSTLAGTASVGSSTLFPDDTKTGSIIIGLVSIAVGILNTINSYFSYSRKAESHRIASISYAKLFSQISVELSLPRKERVSPNELLASLRDSMERLAETTPTPPQHILDEFNQRFKDEDKAISRPIETNGLQKIKIYRDLVDEADHTSPQSKRDVSQPGSARGSSSQDSGRVASSGTQDTEGDSRTRTYPQTTHPLTISIPEPLQSPDGS